MEPVVILKVAVRLFGLAASHSPLPGSLPGKGENRQIGEVHVHRAADADGAAVFGVRGKSRVRVRMALRDVFFGIIIRFPVFEFKHRNGVRIAPGGKFGSVEADDGRSSLPNKCGG